MGKTGGELAQREAAPARKLENLSSIPGSHMMEGSTNSRKLSSDLHKHHEALANMSIYK